ncbi:hypothetical protein M422DRAFT_260364 [Sphaerobolus stellatus SS14]|uniref:NAD-dependent epimerase/dehydratase domain-containing protein n=1 Tax=Sphaerobolus stellatus (strain SS14) TaxID=990650 RepID=A0A0C9VI49_SPHS4|nr:hypothetical protein M422DRAFT_260364 [Sphaerobolus stellatus SS14]
MAPLKVLITGASGFLATWVVKENISRGYFVRGTVRNPAKGDYLKNLYGDKFEYVIVEDMGKDGAFDEAVKDVDAVIHTASPFYYNVKDPQELIGPSVNGTKSIMTSILKHGTKVKRVVLTSAFAAMAPILKPGTVPTRYDESCWSNGAVEDVEKDGLESHPLQVYEASKVLAEKAAWDFVGKHKNEIAWDLITLLTPYIYGPIIYQSPNPASLNTSSTRVLNFLRNDPPRSAEDLVAPAGSFVDVRDAAWAHAEAVTHPTLGNKDAQAAFEHGKGRITLVSCQYCWQDVADALIDATISVPESMPRGEKGAGKRTTHISLVTSTRAREELGLKFRSMTETFADTLNDFQEKGWIEIRTKN